MKLESRRPALISSFCKIQYIGWKHYNQQIHYFYVPRITRGNITHAQTHTHVYVCVLVCVCLCTSVKEASFVLLLVQLVPFAFCFFLYRQCTFENNKILSSLREEYSNFIYAILFFPQCGFK